MHRAATGFFVAIVCLSCRDRTPGDASPVAPTPAAVQSKTPPSDDKTRLERLEDRRGVVLVSGMNEMGKIAGQYGGEVEVTAVEIHDTTSNDRERGVVVRVTQIGPPQREKSSYVDDDEIQKLLSALDALAKTDTSSTRLKSFEAEYTSSDGSLHFATFNTPKEILASVRIGEDPEEARVFLSIDKLGHFRSLVANAKTMLDMADPARVK